MDSQADLEISHQEFPKKTFSIISPMEQDSLGTLGWKRDLGRNRLNEAWSPPEGSPYRHFGKTRTIDSVNKWVNDLKPRYSRGETTSEVGIANLIKSGVLRKDTAVVLDSGGSHSVAMAVKLARESNYQPIVMLDAEVHPQGIGRTEQNLATLLYFAEEVRQLKTKGKIRPDAPPCFILDTHRHKLLRGDETNRVDNRHTYTQKDFPSTHQLREHGITRIVYLNEGDQHGAIIPSFQSIDRVASDLKATVKAWEDGGIKVAYTGVWPWR